MARTLSPSEKVQAARRLRDDWVDMGVQISRLKELRDNTLRDAQRLEREAEAEGYNWANGFRPAHV